MNDPDTSELTKFLAPLSLEELKVHERASISTIRLIAATGITALFGAMVFPNAATIVIAGLGCYVLANFSIGVGIGLAEIRKHMAKFQKTDK